MRPPGVPDDWGPAAEPEQAARRSGDRPRPPTRSARAETERGAAAERHRGEERPAQEAEGPSAREAEGPSEGREPGA
jgi:hypothetical protein